MSNKSNETRGKKVKSILKKLEEGVKDLFTSEKYKQYLYTMSKFHHYSFNNTILIAMQKPDATLVAGYSAWKQKFHRQVKKGEKGITILAPVKLKEKEEGNSKMEAENDEKEHKIHLLFRPVSVFDVSQTEGEPLPSLGVDELTGNAKGYDAFMQAMSKLSPVPIRFDEIKGGAKGYYHTVDKEIVIKKDMSELQTMKTCVHEVSHALLHDRDKMKNEGIEKDQQTKEVEAESVAYVVCSYFNLDTGKDYSFPYIGMWSSSKEMNELKASMDTIQKTAAGLIDGIEANMEKQRVSQKDRPSVLTALSEEKVKLKEGRSDDGKNQISKRALCHER